MTGAKKAILTHWDDFNIPVGNNFKPMPRLFDDFARSMRKLKELGKRDNVEILLPIAFRTFDPKNARST